VRLVCPGGGGGEQGVQALLLAAASPLLAAALLAADPDQESQIVLLPDFSIEEVRHFVHRLLVQGPESCSWGALDHLLLPQIASQVEKDRCCNITSADVNPNYDRNDRSVDNDGVSDEELRDELDSCDEAKMEDFDTIDDPASVDGSRKSEDEKSAKLIDLAEAEALVARYTLFDETGREFGCRRCGKLRTRCRNTLRAHILSELGLFLFSCSLCEKLFRQKGYLNRHLRRHAEGGGRRKRKGDNKSEGLLSCQSGIEHNGGVMTEVEGSQEETYSSETEVIAEDITKECILQSAI
jgi:hypothetical protein